MSDRQAITALLPPNLIRRVDALRRETGELYQRPILTRSQIITHALECWASDVDANMHRTIPRQ